MEGVYQSMPSTRNPNLEYFKLQIPSLTLYGSDMPAYDKPVEVRVSIVDENQKQVAPANIISINERLMMRHDPKVYFTSTQDFFVGLKQNHQVIVQLSNSNLSGAVSTRYLKNHKPGENFFHLLDKGDVKSGIRVIFRGPA